MVNVSSKNRRAIGGWGWCLTKDRMLTLSCQHSDSTKGLQRSRIRSQGSHWKPSKLHLSGRSSIRWFLKRPCRVRVGERIRNLRHLSVRKQKRGSWFVLLKAPQCWFLAYLAPISSPLQIHVQSKWTIFERCGFTDVQNFPLSWMHLIRTC